MKKYRKSFFKASILISTILGSSEKCEWYPQREFNGIFVWGNRADPIWFLNRTDAGQTSCWFCSSTVPKYLVEMSEWKEFDINEKH